MTGLPPFNPYDKTRRHRVLTSAQRAEQCALVLRGNTSICPTCDVIVPEYVGCCWDCWHEHYNADLGNKCVAQNCPEHGDGLKAER
jgi:hypothetical protein